MSSSHAIVDDIQKVRSANIREYRSTPVMTKYEFNQLISLRVTQSCKRGYFICSNARRYESN